MSTLKSMMYALWDERYNTLSYALGILIGCGIVAFLVSRR